MPKKSNLIIKEDNALARAAWRVKSIWAKRLVAFVVSQIRVTDTDLTEYTLDVRELLEKCGRKWDIKTCAEVVAGVVEVFSTPLKFRNNAGNLIVCNAMSVCELDEKTGFLTAKIAKELQPYYLQLQREFTKIPLLDMCSLSILPAQKLYEILCSYSGLEHIKIYLEQLHQTLNSSKASKANFAYFRSKVLDPSVEEICRKTSLQVTWNPITEKSQHGRPTVVAIDFVFVKHATAPAPETDIEKLDRQAAACFDRHYRYDDSSRLYDPIPGKAACKMHDLPPHAGIDRLRAITKSAKCIHCCQVGAMAKYRYRAIDLARDRGEI